MKVAVAARNPEKSVMKRLAEDYGVACYGCDAREPDQVASLFESIEEDLGNLTLSFITSMAEPRYFQKVDNGSRSSVGPGHDQELNLQRVFGWAASRVINAVQKD